MQGLIMDEKCRKSLCQEESLALVIKDISAPKPNDVEIPQNKTDDFDDKDFVWGIKQSGNKYKTVTIKNELYALNDCVRCRSGLELDYIGKIMKLSQENGQKVCTLRWFFRPFELPTSLKEIYKAADSRELFLAFGEGIGVENRNLLVSYYNVSNIRSFYNVENVVSLGVITGKCKVLCIAEDDFNDLPSSEHLNMCDFFFSTAFDCDTLKIIGLDGVVDAIGAQKVYNKKEWLSWNKINTHSTSLTSSPKKTLCQSFGLHTLPTNSSDIKILSLPHNSSSLSIREQSTERILMEKRKRDSREKSVMSQKMMERIKKIKITPSSKNLKLSGTLSLTKEEDQTTKSISEVKSALTIVDAVNTSIVTLEPILYKGFQPIYDEMLITAFGSGQIDGNSKSYTGLSLNAPAILEQTVEEVGTNADDIHITCEGFPRESFFEPLEKSENSTSKLKKDENNSKFVVAENRTSEITEEPPNSEKNKTALSKAQRATSKIVQNKTKKKSSNVTTDTMLSERTKRKSRKSNISTKTENKRQKVTNHKTKGQIFDTSNSHNSQKLCENLMKTCELTCLENQQPLGSPLARTKPTTIGENLLNKGFSEPSRDNVKNTSVYNTTTPHEEEFESKCEDWDEVIQKAIATKRVILLNNVDPELHSLELQEAFSKFLETKCEVRKIMSDSFYYNTASALLKLMTPDITQRSLQNLCKDCLIVGERTIIATLYEGLEFAQEFSHFHGHICIQPKGESQKENCIEMDILPHLAQGNTIEFTFGLRWRLLQEQHELQWQLLNELHKQELNLLNKEAKRNKRLKKSK